MAKPIELLRAGKFMAVWDRDEDGNGFFEVRYAKGGFTGLSWENGVAHLFKELLAKRRRQRAAKRRAKK